MGYDISEAQHNKLERHKREGRLCRMSTGRGGCFNRASWRELHESWTYRIGEGPRRESLMEFCSRHRSAPGTEGVNFRVLATTAY